MKINFIKSLTAFSVILFNLGSAVAQTSFTHPVQLDTTHQSSGIIKFDVQLYPDSTNEKFVLYISNPLSEKLRISISGPEGIGFTDQVKDHYRKRIVLSNAVDGDYRVTVSSDKLTITRSLKLRTSTEVKRSLVTD